MEIHFQNSDVDISILSVLTTKEATRVQGKVTMGQMKQNYRHFKEILMEYPVHPVTHCSEI